MQTAANSSRGLFASRSSTPSGWHPDEYPDVKFNLGVDPTDFLAAAEKVAQELTQKSFTNPRPNCTIICATLYEGLWVAAVMPIRRPIPKAIEHAVLMINQSVCCICRKPNVQIHHIDGNPANNKPSNLCVLCIEHHAQASSKGAMTKGLEPSLLRKYKNHWESVVSTTTNILTPQRPTKISKAELTNIRFEVKREIFRIPTLSEHQTRATLDYLQYLNYETHNSNFIIKDIEFIHWFMEAKHLKIVAEQVYDLFLHLVGPHMVALRNVDRREMSKTIELLADLGDRRLYLTINQRS